MGYKKCSAAAVVRPLEARVIGAALPMFHLSPECMILRSNVGLFFQHGGDSGCSGDIEYGGGGGNSDDDDDDDR